MGSVLFTRVERIVLYAVVLAGWWLSPSVSAATGNIYLTPATSNLSNGSEVSLALRINPGTPVDGVRAEIGYENNKLQFVSLSQEGSAFPEIAEQNTESNPITLTRTTSGGSVTGDSLIVTLRFKALASSGNTVITVTGNAAQGASPTDPSTQGATITFVSSSPQPPASPSKPSPQTPSNPNPQKPPTQQPTPTPSPPPATEQPTNQPASSDSTKQPAPQTIQRRFWWVGLLVMGIFLVAGAGVYWLLHHRRSNAADIAPEHPIDTTWATTTGPAKTEDTTINELLERTPKVDNPEPGSVITPKPPDPKK